MPENKIIYDIIEYDLESNIEDMLRKTIDNISKKIGKKYNAVIELHITPTQFKNEKTGEIVSGYNHKIIVLMPEIKYRGYEYVSTLKKETPSSPYSQVFPVEKYKDEDFSKYYESKFRCDHCGTKRPRKMVHLFRNELGEEKMIASTCSKEYFGVDIATKINNLLNYQKLKELFYGEISETIDRYRKEYMPIDMLHLIKCAYGVIKLEGRYVSYTKSERERIPQTSILVSICYEELPSKFSIKALNAAADLDPSDVLAYWSNIEPDNTFMHNVKTAFTMDRPQIGLIAWGVFEYINKVERYHKPSIGEPVSVGHFGSIGDNITLEVKVTDTKFLTTKYGETDLIEMIDSQGHKFVWWCNNLTNLSNRPYYTYEDDERFRVLREKIIQLLSYEGVGDLYSSMLNIYINISEKKINHEELLNNTENYLHLIFGVGSTIQISGKIKSHDIYKDTKITKLTRCSVRRIQ